MSNKTQLQTNNTNLDALIARVNAAKDTAASLPDAGSGGSGGGSGETCTITIEVEAPTMGQVSLFYMDGSSSVKSFVLPDFGDTASVKVLKNSIICTDGVSLYCAETESNLTEIFNMYGYYAGFISGDVTIGVR